MIKQLLTFFLYPLGTSITAFLGGFLFLWFGKKRHALILVGIGLGWMLLWSFQPVSYLLVRHLEEKHIQHTLNTLQTADVLVVFGGGMAPGGSIHPYPDLTAASDRIWHAARLYHAGLAPHIIVSGGKYRYQGIWPSDAYSMRRFLVDLGVPDAAIVSDSLSTNSYENALNTDSIMTSRNWQSVILVTSALHMPRSLETMRTLRSATQPAPTDYLVAAEEQAKVDWVPSSEYLQMSTQAFHEVIGLYWYRIKNKIR